MKIKIRTWFLGISTLALTQQVNSASILIKENLNNIIPLSFGLFVGFFLYPYALGFIFKTFLPETKEYLMGAE